MKCSFLQVGKGGCWAKGGKVNTYCVEEVDVSVFHFV